MTENVRNIFTRNEIEYSVPLTFEDETVGRATVHPNGDITFKLGFSKAAMRIRDQLTEGILDNLSLDDTTEVVPQTEGAQ